MGWESSAAVRLDLGPLHQGQTRTAKLKSAYDLLIIGPRVCNVKPTYRKSRAMNLFLGGSLALVSCLSSGYKFTLVLQCTRSSYS